MDRSIGYALTCVLQAQTHPIRKCHSDPRDMRLVPLHHGHRMHIRISGLSLALVLLAPVLSSLCPAQEPAASSGLIAQLRPTRVETPIAVDGKRNAAIVCPAGDALGELAGRLVQRIGGLTGALLPVVSWDEVTQGVAERHLIVLGNMENNRVALDLYVQHQIACDLLYPGKGGFVVRTVHDPWGRDAMSSCSAAVMSRGWPQRWTHSSSDCIRVEA